MNHLILLNDPPYGTERSFIGLRMAHAPAKNDPDTNACGDDRAPRSDSRPPGRASRLQAMFMGVDRGDIGPVRRRAGAVETRSQGALAVACDISREPALLRPAAALVGDGKRYPARGGQPGVEPRLQALHIARHRLRDGRHPLGDAASVAVARDAVDGDLAMHVPLHKPVAR